MELDGLRNVLEQAEGRAKIETLEIQSMQERYSNMQAAISRCNEQIEEEIKMKAELKAKLPGVEDPEKQRVRDLHRQLTRVEANLSQVCPATS